MSIEEIYEDLLSNNNVIDCILGEITLDSTGGIRCQYDALLNGHDMTDEHFSEVYETNKETITEYLEDIGVNDEYLITEYEINDTILIFNIIN